MSVRDAVPASLKCKELLGGLGNVMTLNVTVVVEGLGERVLQMAEHPSHLHRDILSLW